MHPPPCHPYLPDPQPHCVCLCVSPQAPESAWLSVVGVFDELHAVQKLSTPQVGGGGPGQPPAAAAATASDATAAAAGASAGAALVPAPVW